MYPLRNCFRFARRNQCANSPFRDRIKACATLWPVRKDGHCLGANQCRNSAAGPDVPLYRFAKPAGRPPVWSRPHHSAILQGTPGAAVAAEQVLHLPAGHHWA